MPLARSLTSLDQVSGGRLDVGLGIGWMRDEYTAVGADFARRGALLDELLDVLHGVWTREEFGHRGRRWTIPDAYVGLRPVQPAGPPPSPPDPPSTSAASVRPPCAGWAAGQQIRCDPAPGATADAIATLLDGVRATGADGCFVDLQQSVDTPDEALELGVKILGLLRG
ncbi:LLM class flavin-dependent oxidoreductase [Streptomyces sp. R302]|nr:LLM class flavin-dependent oxidoreductase [Streptomyces sp. R301]NML81780.1 LLM class flavin-dependent oxidoreductase [Streptomyces sp. R302]